MDAWNFQDLRKESWESRGATLLATVLSIAFICISPAGLEACCCSYYIFGAWERLLRSLWSLLGIHQAAVSPQSFCREQPQPVVLSQSSPLSPLLSLFYFLSHFVFFLSISRPRGPLQVWGKRGRGEKGFCKTKPDLSLSYYSSGHRINVRITLCVSPALKAPSQGPLLLSERKCWHLVEVTCRISPKALEDQHTVSWKCCSGLPASRASLSPSGQWGSLFPSGRGARQREIRDIWTARWRATYFCPTPSIWARWRYCGPQCSATWSFHYLLWRRKWQPTPVFLLGKSHGWRNLVGP